MDNKQQHTHKKENREIKKAKTENHKSNPPFWEARPARQTVAKVLKKIIRTRKNIEKMQLIKIISKFIRNKIMRYKIKQAIKQANKLRTATGRKHLVLKFDGKIIVVSKKKMRKLIAKGVINTNIRTVEKISIYATI